MYYSNERLIELLQQKAAELGKTPTVKEMNSDPNMPSPYIYVSRFCSWIRALDIAGLELPNYSRPTYSDERLITLLRKKATELGRTPTIKEVNLDPNMPAPITYRNRFGEWKKALEVAGLEACRSGCRHVFSDQRLIKALQQKAAELDRIPVVEDIEDDLNMPSQLTYMEHFGSWEKALKAAGLEKNVEHKLKAAGLEKNVERKQHPRSSDERALALLREKAANYNRKIVIEDEENCDPTDIILILVLQALWELKKTVDAMG